MGKNAAGDFAVDEKRETAKIKKELAGDDIKEYAETAMNELLGWYGYQDKVTVSRSEDSVAGVASSSSPSRRPTPSHSGGDSSESESPQCQDSCGWCGKSVSDPAEGLSSTTGIFCSELCFSQSRRASFKRNKTCDWCRHVRHTVSYVDFQDGASQLQFCSDKCLNQYKMHIFCRETRAHLEMHPHMHAEDTSGGLITPELWMKNCKSSPERDKSVSPPSPSQEFQTSPLPLITITPTSKLMPPEKMENRQRTKTKKCRKRPPSTITSKSFDATQPQDLRIRTSPSVEGEPPKTNIWNPASFPPRTYAQPLYPPPQFAPPQMRLPPLPTPHPHPPTSSLLPPVTVLVPYPIAIPIPLPIPIPIPINLSKLKMDQTSSQCETTNDCDSSQANVNEPPEEEKPKEKPVDEEAAETATKPLRKKKRVNESKEAAKNKKGLPA